MATEKLVVIKETALSSNCPECFNQNLKLTFYQKHIYGKLSHRTTNKITNHIICKTCGSDIYPAKWTADIELMFNYYQKMVVPESSSLKFTSLFYILIITAIVALSALAYLFYIQVLTA